MVDLILYFDWKYFLCFILIFIYYYLRWLIKSKVIFLFFLMPPRMQKTVLYKSSAKILDKLANWAANPWRRYSLLVIIFLLGFLIGSSLGMINGVLALMDPVGAFITLIFLELLIKARFFSLKSKKPIILIRVVDMFRIGITYGLFSEGLKLL